MRRTRAVSFVAAGVVALAAAVRWRPRIVVVEGSSMEPSLFPGDRVLLFRSAPRVGIVVVAEHPTRPGFELVKRIAAGPGETVIAGPAPLLLGVDQWWLEGDAGEGSTDSRRFGPVEGPGITARAVVVLALHPRLVR